MTSAIRLGVLAAASRARQVILGSYLTAAATAAYIRDSARVDALARGEDVIVTLVAMGFEGLRRSIEDERCADYLEHLLIGTPYDHLRAVNECMHDADIAASLRGEHDYRPREDIILALQRDVRFRDDRPPRGRPRTCDPAGHSLLGPDDLDAFVAAVLDRRIEIGRAVERNRTIDSSIAAARRRLDVLRRFGLVQRDHHCSLYAASPGMLSRRRCRYFPFLT